MIAVVLAGPSRWARRLREFAAPYMHERPAMLFGVVAVIYLLLVWWGPTPAFRTGWTLIVTAALLIFGTEMLRRQTAREFPDARLPGGEGSRPAP